ncbi:HupE/UreJ family protein, partial [Candidatus Albibeggiatoa sp. nov. BB20]|uniref:HupE/UreJ family protein n=1 Tax=Candidatus Albibeggiatoa sp. nov. BB20 TaxID=3162723 RepID=UPI0033659D39
MNKTFLKLLGFILIGLLPVSAYAHHTGVEITGFVAGILHPLTGLDHLLAMIAVGLWASQMSHKARWTLPISFIAVMIVGAVLPVIGISVPYVETGILLSLLVLGGLVATVLPLAVSIM